MVFSCLLRCRPSWVPRRTTFSRHFSGGSSRNPLNHLVQTLPKNGGKYYSLPGLGDPRLNTLPISIRVLLESAVRNCDGHSITEKDVETILAWRQSSEDSKEIPFLPARVLLQDFTGVPAVVDLAAMRDGMKRLGGDPSHINPLVPVDLVVDHSIQADFSRGVDSLVRNQEMEMQRNSERFAFLKWGAKAFNNMLIVPPGSGIVHQVNLEFLARCVFERDGFVFPDSLVGTDSHTTMINGLGIVGWGVGGIEAEAVMLGQPISMVLPKVVGFKLVGALHPQTTATDLVLTATQILRAKKVVGKFVEFHGPGSASLSLADRATIGNMAPEYGATMGFFPVDAESLRYLKKTGRPAEQVSRVEEYLRANKMLVEEGNNGEDIEYSETLELDLGSVEPSLAGPKRPQDRVAVNNMKTDFKMCLSNPIGFKGFNLPTEEHSTTSDFVYNGQKYSLGHGSVVIAAITSCTNTSNPSVMLGAGLLARNAVLKGLKVPPYIKTTLSPGSKAVSEYLKVSGLDVYLEKLGYFNAGYGCMTCIGNSGDLDKEVADAITSKETVAAAVLSGNRNFEGRTHPLTRANYLASPPLVVAYSLVGKVDFDFEANPIGTSNDGSAVYLRDIWPSPKEIADVTEKCVTSEMFGKVYANIQNGTTAWRNLDAPTSTMYPWGDSTYIHNPPFFRDTTVEVKPMEDIRNGRCLLLLSHSITTDHISPAGNIAKNSAAALYLENKGVDRKDFNTYGARRGNDEVMLRGTFANIRLINQMCPKAGPKSVHLPSGEIGFVADVAERYRSEGVPMVIVAGQEYGSGSSRDWAAKGPYLLGVKAIIAESFERIHRTNLVGMGILPLQFLEGQNAQMHNLTGHEMFTIELNGGCLLPGQTVNVKVDNGTSFDVRCRIDTDVEATYFQNGGILQFVLRKLLKESKTQQEK